MEPNSPSKNNSSNLSPRPVLDAGQGGESAQIRTMPKLQQATAGEQPPQNTSPRSSIHTLEGDIFTAMKDDNYANNIVKIVTDPAKNTQSSQSADAETRSFIKKIATASIIFIVLVGGVFAYFFIAKDEEGGDIYAVDPNATSTTGLSSTTPAIIKTTSVLEAEAIIQLNLKELNKNSGIEKIQQIQQELRDKQIAKGTTVELSLGLTMPELFAKNQYSGEEGLIRSLTNNYSFGLYNNKDNVFESFLIFKMSSPDLAFSNMLAWERYLPSDLEALFADTSVVTVDPNTEPQASTTATTTPLPARTLTTPGFSDKVLRNTDARIYTNAAGEVRFVYGFINKQYLIISGGVESFIDVKTRLLNNYTLR